VKKELTEADLVKGHWIKVEKEWCLLDGSKPEERPELRIEGRCEGYGCDTGCIGYRIYLVKDGESTELDFEFCPVEAVEMAEDYAREAAKEEGLEEPLPVVIEKDWSA
jgi:hypothetical protein